MGAPGRLVGICQPLAGGCVFGLAEQSGSLLWVLDGEMGSIPVTEKLHAYPSSNPKLTLTCYQLTIGGGGGCAGTQRLTPTQDMFVIHLYFELKIISIGFCSFMLSS